MPQQPIHLPVLEVATDYPHWVKELADAEANGLRLLAALKASNFQLERVLNLMGLDHDHVAETVLYRGKDAIAQAERYEARTAEG